MSPRRPKVSEKCCMATPKCHHVEPKCPILKPKCPLFIGQFVLLSFVFNKLAASVVIFFLPPSFPDLGRSINCRFSIADCRVPHFQFRISGFQSPVSIFQSGAAAERVRAARSLASLPGCAIPSRRHASVRLASNSYAVILWINYQEIKRGMHGDLTHRSQPGRSWLNDIMLECGKVRRSRNRGI
jgi:hypothetical protein